MIWFGINLVIIGFVLINLIVRMHLTGDSVFHLYSDHGENAYRNLEVFLTRANYTDFLIKAPQVFLGFDLVLGQHYYYAIMVIVLAIAVTIVARTLTNLLENRSRLGIILIDLAVVIAFVNPFVMEIMLFPECALFVATEGISASLAVLFIARRGRANYLLSLLFMVLALGCYQAILAVIFSFITLLAWLEFYRNRHFVSAFRLWLRSFSCCLLATIFNVAFMKVASILIPNERTYGTVTSSASRITDNVTALIAQQPAVLINAWGSSLRYAFVALLLILIILVLVALRKSPPLVIVVLFIALVAAYISAYAPHIVSANMFAPPRSLHGAWSALACFLLIPLAFALDASRGGGSNNASTRICGDVSKRSRLTVTLTCLIPASTLLFTLGTLTITADLTYDNLLSNQGDEIVARQIGKEIDDYEHKTGITVTDIAVVNDQSAKQHYPGIRYTGYTPGDKMIQSQWGAASTVRYYSGKEIVQVEMPDDVYSRYFKDKNWDELNLDEQLVFVGEHAYLVNY